MPANYTSFSVDTPRSISFLLKLRIFFKGPTAFVGIIFLLAGCIFPVVFGRMADFRSMFVFKDSDPVAPGIITHLRPTSSSINDREVYEYGFIFRANAQDYSGRSFSTDRYDVSDTVQVQYKAEDPFNCKVQNMGTAPFSAWLFFAMLSMPVFGLIFSIRSVITGRRNIALVEHGVLAKGKITRKESTLVSVNDQKVFKVFFSFQSADRSMREAFVRTHRIEQLKEGIEIPVLYDAADPSKAVLVDTLPKPVKELLSSLF